MFEKGFTSGIEIARAFTAQDFERYIERSVEDAHLLVASPLIAGFGFHLGANAHVWRHPVRSVRANIAFLRLLLQSA